MTTPTNHKFTATCLECGESFGSQKRAQFCAPTCKKVFHNRRMKRGAEMYDLVMTMRFDRGHAKDEALWSQLCAMAAAYNIADKASRGNRKSYDKNAHKRLPLTYSMNSGDGR